MQSRQFFIVGGCVSAALIVLVTVAMTGRRPIDKSMSVANNEDTMRHALELSEQEVDFGSVFDGVICTKRISVRNTSAKSIQIVSYRASCGCSTLSDDLPFYMKPRETKEITARFDTHGKQGQIVSSISINTLEAGQERRYPLKIKALCLPSVSFSNEGFDFGELRRGETKTLETIVTIHDYGPGASPPTIISMPEHVMAHLAEQPAEQSENRTSKSWRLVCELSDEKLAEMPMDDVLLISSSSTVYPVKRIGVRAAPYRAVRLEPHALLFGVIGGETAATSSVVLTGKDGQKFCLEDVRIADHSADDSLSVDCESVRTNEFGVNLKVLLSLSPQKCRPSFVVRRVEFIYRLESGLKESVYLTVRAYCRK